MELKKTPMPQPLLITSLILHRDSYKIDPTYQRADGIWSVKDEQYLIDTILRGYSMPSIFLKTKKKNEYIIDGQQRIRSIMRFYDEEIELSDRYSEDIIWDKSNVEDNDGKSARYYSELSKEWRVRFDGYALPAVFLSDYDDEQIRDLFRRLQSGKDLTPGEKINALPGDIVKTMRTLARHPFFMETVSMEKKRYKHYYIAAQLMYLESEGIRNISPDYIYTFFDDNRNLATDSKIAKRVKKNLNYLYRVFPQETWQLSKPSWIITLYLATSYLLDTYSMNQQIRNYRKFYLEFHDLFLDPASIKGKQLNDFHWANRSSTNNQQNIERRHRIMKIRFLKEYTPRRLDENRSFNTVQKKQIYDGAAGKCEKGGESLNFGSKRAEYHHKDRFIDGGQTAVENGMLVCTKCHKKIHGEVGK